MNYLIKRKAGTSRDELLMHWFANHMPEVIQRQIEQKENQHAHAERYVATIFEEQSQTQIENNWDGMAQLWWEKELKRPREPHGTDPSDTFQELAEPFVPWATNEYVVIDGEPPFRSLTLNRPFPTTRSGCYKATFLVKAKKSADYDLLFAHWLGDHAANVKALMERVKGIRYVIGHSTRPKEERHVGMAEMYFVDQQQFFDFNKGLKLDGLEKWIDHEQTTVLISNTQMIGIA